MTDKYTCSKCKSLTVPHTVGDGTTGEYRKCISCNYVAEIWKFVRMNANTPLGSSNPADLLNPGQYTVIQTRRTKQRPRNNLGRGRNSKQEVIPPLAGKPDRDLEVLLQHGVLLSLEDSVMEDE